VSAAALLYDAWMDQGGRLLRIAESLARLADDEEPLLLQDLDEGPLGELERQVNRLIRHVESRSQERMLFSVGPAVVFRWRNEENWPVEYVSPNVIGLTGYPAEEYLSGARVYTDLMHPDDIARIAKELEELMASGVEWFRQSPYRIVRRDGEARWVDDYAVVRRDGAGEITHFFGYIFDVTDRVEQALQLERNEEVFQRIESPILHIWDGILAMPVIGTLSEVRAAGMMERLLEEISRGGVEFAILDLTGLEAIDATTVEHVARTVSAVRLLGCACLVSGISPVVASTLVSLGVDLSSFETFSTLRAALGHALGRANGGRRGRSASSAGRAR